MKMQMTGPRFCGGLFSLPGRKDSAAPLIAGTRKMTDRSCLRPVFLWDMGRAPAAQARSFRRLCKKADALRNT